MAIMVPNHPEWANIAEKQVAESLLRALPTNSILYVHPFLGAWETDLIIFFPDQGFVVVEIKDWRAGRFQVVDANHVLYETGYGEQSFPSPRHQLNGYRYTLVNILMGKNLNGAVLPIVFFPHLSRQDYLETSLNLVIPSELTACEEEYLNPAGFMGKVKDLFNRFHAHIHTYTNEEIHAVRLLFETEAQINNNYLGGSSSGESTASEVSSNTGSSNGTSPTASVGNSSNSDSGVGSVNYSLLVLTNDIDQVDNLLQGWRQGRKTILISQNEAVLKAAFAGLEKQIQDLHLEQQKAFKTRDKQGNPVKDVFLFQLFHTEIQLPEVKIMDGDTQELENHWQLLEDLAEDTGFNLEQYRLEHAPIYQNIMVKAGAGTGKTYSMISRINFLIYAHGWDADLLIQNLVMITFTNDSASTMKLRLRENIQNAFLLTRDVKYMTMLEKLENVQISTIHSFAKSLLKNYSWKLGLGRDLSVVSYLYESRKILEQCVNEYIDRQMGNRYIEALGMDMHVLIDRLRQIMEGIQGRNIDILRDPIQLGQAKNDKLCKLIGTVLVKAEKVIRDNLNRENKIRVNDLMLKLKELLDVMNGEPVIEKISYIFVDEFQDTDDVQIYLLKQIQKASGCSLFVVGDVKQCIYRFRGAQHRSFDILTDNDPHWALEFSLTKNYRTDRHLLLHFEKLFSQWINNSLGKLLPYEPGKDSLVGMKEYNSPSNPGFSIIRAESDEDFEETFIDNLKTARAAMKESQKLAILVRENWEIHQIRKLAEKYRIYIHSDIGGGLFQVEPALDLYRVVMAVQYPDNPKFLLNLYQTYYIRKQLPVNEVLKRRKNPEELLELFKKEQGDLWHGWAKDLEKEPVLKVIRSIINEQKPWQNYREYFETPEDQRDAEDFYRRNMDQLYEQLFKLGETDYLTINKLAKYLEIMIMTGSNQETRQQRQTTEDGGRKILCTTVHKAKGLEYDTVLMINGTRNLERVSDKGAADVIIKWDPTAKEYHIGYNLSGGGEDRYTRIQNEYYTNEKDHEKNEKICEETRILYVALTRAEKQVICFQRPAKSKGLTWQKLLGGED